MVFNVWITGSLPNLEALLSLEQTQKRACLRCIFRVTQLAHNACLFYICGNKQKDFSKTHLIPNFLIDDLPTQHWKKKSASAAHGVYTAECPQQVVCKIQRVCGGGGSSKPCAAMHESQSIACVCFIYSLVTRSLKRKKRKYKKVPFK